MSKVLTLIEDNDVCMYRTPCDCGIPEDDLELTIYYDNRYKFISILIGGKFYVWKRIKEFFKGITTGYFSGIRETIICDHNQLGELIEALQKAKTLMESNNENQS